MNLRNGKEFAGEKPEVVTSYLRGLFTSKFEINSQNLSLYSKGEDIILNTVENEFPIRQSFLYKLLKWYNFPLHSVSRLSSESLVSIGNDYLISINKNVNVYIENGDALAITSLDYSEFKNLAIIKLLESLKIKTVSRNDFFTTINIDEKYEIEPFKGDKCGIGLIIYNSQTGFRALSVFTYLLRYSCSNGAVIRTNEGIGKLYHYQKEECEFSELITSKVEFLEVEKDLIMSSIKKMKSEYPDEKTISGN